MHILASLDQSTRAIHSRRPAERAAASTPEESAPATEVPATTADAPATTHHLSGSGRLLGLLQKINDRHPEESDRVLNGIADKLRSDAERAGPWSDRLNAWADRFEKAAESNDLSNLLPSYRPFGHFGFRAYRDNAGEPGGDDVAAVVSSVGVATPPTSSENGSSVAPETIASAAPVVTPTAPEIVASPSPVVTAPTTVPNPFASPSPVVTAPTTVPNPFASPSPVVTAPTTTVPEIVAPPAPVLTAPTTTAPETVAGMLPVMTSPIDPSVISLTVEPDPSLPSPDTSLIAGSDRYSSLS